MRPARWRVPPPPPAPFGRPAPIFVVGDLGCGDLDVAAWRSQNRAPVYPGRVQRWIIAAVFDEPKGDADAREACLEFLWENFGESWHVYTPIEASGVYRVGGRIDLLKFNAISAQPIVIPSDKRAGRAQDLPHPPMLAGNAVTYFDVDLVWRGSETTIPWPTWNGGQFAGQTLTDAMKFCPDGCRWMLWQVSQPGVLAEEDQGQIGHIARAAGEVASGIAKGAGEAATQFALGGWRALLYVGVGIALVYVARNALGQGWRRA